MVIKAISTTIKMCLYKATNMPTVIDTSETWKDTAWVAQNLKVIHQWCLDRILHVTYQYWVTNDDILQRIGSWSLHDIVMEHRLWLAGHILHVPTHLHPKTATKCTALGGKQVRKAQGDMVQHITCRSTLIALMSGGRSLESIAVNHPQWRQHATWCAQKHRRNWV